MSETREFVSEADRVAHWKYEFFLELTGDEREAQWLTLMGIDPHDLKRLLNAKCPLDVAKRILTPV